MRKTYSNSAVEDVDFDDLPLARQSQRRQRQPERRSRFDDFDEEALALDDSYAEPESARAAPRGKRGKSLTFWQWMWHTTAGRWVFGISALVVFAVLAGAGWLVHEFLRTDPRFRIAGSDQVQVESNQQVTADSVRQIFGEDIGRNLFFIPIRERQQQLESLPWVEHASVERLLPNQIRVKLMERVPVAFAQDGARIALIDSHGVLLDPPTSPHAPHFSFPVLDGVGTDVPLSTRAARMSEYQGFLKDVDGHGEKVSARLSEVDLSDPEDMQAVIMEGPTPLTLHFGEEQFFQRYQIYQAHLSEWQQQYPRLAKVDLSNAPQVVLGMAEGERAAAPAPASSTPAVPAAASTANKPAVDAVDEDPVKKATSTPAAQTAVRPVVAKAVSPQPHAARKGVKPRLHVVPARKHVSARPAKFTTVAAHAPAKSVVNPPRTAARPVQAPALKQPLRTNTANAPHAPKLVIKPQPHLQTGGRQ